MKKELIYKWIAGSLTVSTVVVTMSYAAITIPNSQSSSVVISAQNDNSTVLSVSMWNGLLEKVSNIYNVAGETYIKGDLVSDGTICDSNGCIGSSTGSVISGSGSVWEETILSFLPGAQSGIIYDDVEVGKSSIKAEKVIINSLPTNSKEGTNKEYVDNLFAQSSSSSSGGVLGLAQEGTYYTQGDLDNGDVFCSRTIIDNRGYILRNPIYENRYKKCDLNKICGNQYTNTYGKCVPGKTSLVGRNYELKFYVGGEFSYSNDNGIPDYPIAAKNIDYDGLCQIMGFSGAMGVVNNEWRTTGYGQSYNLYENGNWIQKPNVPFASCLQVQNGKCFGGKSSTNNAYEFLYSSHVDCYSIF